MTCFIHLHGGLRHKTQSIDLKKKKSNRSLFMSVNTVADLGNSSTSHSENVHICLVVDLRIITPTCTQHAELLQNLPLNLICGSCQWPCWGSKCLSSQACGGHCDLYSTDHWHTHLCRRSGTKWPFVTFSAGQQPGNTVSDFLIRGWY